jgi:uncharacterized repeat protein (TIGR01451 family)
LLSVENATISDNFSTGSGGGIVVVADPLGLPASVTASFILRNTIISGNGGQECLVQGTSDPINGHVGTVDAQGGGNLILDNNGCPGVTVTTDPQLQALAVDNRSQMGTPTLALPAGSPAIDAGDDDHILPTDQRGIARPQGPHGDIGAFEFRLFTADLSLASQASTTQIVAGHSFAYTIQLTNHGPDDAERVVFTDLAPAGVTFTSCNSTAGACTLSGGGASINLGTLPNSETVTITIQAALSATAANGTLANTPSVTSDTSDPDTSNNSGSAASAVITAIADKTPPAIAISANPLTLWPPNGRMVPVTVSGTITDADSGVNPSSGSFAVSDEYGAVQPAGSLTINPDGTYLFTVNLEASRHGTDKDGRQYTISVFAKDNAGNPGSSSIIVSVPHDQGH